MADPRIVDDPGANPTTSPYGELREPSYIGAQVLHAQGHHLPRA